MAAFSGGGVFWLHAPMPSSPKVLRKAVSGMLPKNKLRKVFMERLHLFSDTVGTPVHDGAGAVFV